MTTRTERVDSSSKKVVDNEEEKFLVERAIERMETGERRCAHPVHGHAFRQVNMFTSFIFSAGTINSLRKCEGCQGRLRDHPIHYQNCSSRRGCNYNGNGNGKTSEQQQPQQIVKCVSCGVMAHRDCALSRTAAPWQGSLCRDDSPAPPPPTAVFTASPTAEDNAGPSKRRRLKSQDVAVHDFDDDDEDVGTQQQVLDDLSSSSLRSGFAAAAAVGGCYHVEENTFPPPQHHPQHCHDDDNAHQAQQQQQRSSAMAHLAPPKSLFPFLSPKSLLKSTPQLDTLPADQEQQRELPQSSSHGDKDTNKSEQTGLDSPTDDNDVDDAHWDDDDDDDDDQAVTDDDDDDEDEENHHRVQIKLPEQYMTWTPQGPPPHWASTALTDSVDDENNDDHDVNKDGNAKNQVVTCTIPEPAPELSTFALDFVNQSFSSVSRALQDSITTPFFRRLSFDSSATTTTATSTSNHNHSDARSFFRRLSFDSNVTTTTSNHSISDTGSSSSSSQHGLSSSNDGVLQNATCDNPMAPLPPPAQEIEGANNTETRQSEAAVASSKDQIVVTSSNLNKTSDSPFNFVHHSFATVSRVLQENIMANLQPKQQEQQQHKEADSSNIVQNNEKVPMTPVSKQGEEDKEGGTPKNNHSLDVEDMDPSDARRSALVARDANSPSLPTSADVDQASATTSVATVDVDHSTDKVSRLRLATVAGGIAGGVAGLLIAGPAGAVLGAKCAQTAGVLGVLLEGSVQIGVLVASVAAVKYTAQQFQHQHENRLLTIGGGGNSSCQRKVLLVRPNIIVDPVWDEICADARKLAHQQVVQYSQTGGGAPHFLAFKLFPTAEEKEAELAKRERYHQDSDIVQTDEDEIPTAEKILLLVSRILNDKSSLPGFVYRYLIKEFKTRCKSNNETMTKAEDLESPADNNSVACSESCHGNGQNEKADVDPMVSRARRQDAHAVIKHVTATLIDLRPGFASSETMTELTATAVEGLVFGELYNLVFEEIVQEEQVTDKLLLDKILDLENCLANDGGKEKWFSSHLSQRAIESLLRLPQAHSAVDKLRVCVDFLDCIAQHFTSSSSSSPSPNEEDALMGADSLLKMACQHIVAAMVPNLNAEIAFLEEFARDEHLLRSKEGYALVTLQASTHFLNLSDNLYNDIFAESS